MKYSEMTIKKAFEPYPFGWDCECDADTKEVYYSTYCNHCRKDFKAEKPEIYCENCKKGNLK